MNERAALAIRVLLFTGALLWAALAGRLLTWIALGLFCILIATFPILRRFHLYYITVILLVLLPLLPFDISFRNMPGPPRFVRYVMGLPAKETRERAERGEIILGGCMVGGFEPRWIWVW